MNIEGANGPGFGAVVNQDGHLLARAIGYSEQRFISDAQENAFQIWGLHTYAGAGTKGILLLQNEETDGSVLVVTYVRLQNWATTGTPAFDDYWKFLANEGRASAGDDISADTAQLRNMNLGSSKLPAITAYDNAWVGDGVGEEFDRQQPNGNAMATYNKEGSLIIPRGKSFAIQFVSANITAGTAYARISFLKAKRYKDIV